MKKIIIFILLIILGACGTASKDSPGSIMMDSISIDGEMFQVQDSVSLFYPSLSGDSIAIVKSEYTALLDTPKTDTTKKIIRNSIIETRLDTTSNLPLIRKNMEIIDYQQKQLDSLIRKKK